MIKLLLTLLQKKSSSLELRHQRSSDVILDFARPNWRTNYKTIPQPHQVYAIIETLLPNSLDQLEARDGTPRLIEMYVNAFLDFRG